MYCAAGACVKGPAAAWPGVALGVCVCVCVVCQHSSAAAVLGWQGGCVGSGLCRTGTAIIAPAIFSWSAQRWKVPYRPGLMSLVESSAGGRGGRHGVGQQL